LLFHYGEVSLFQLNNSMRSLAAIIRVTTITTIIIVIVTIIPALHRGGTL
jgi:hypothetical protein